MVSLYVKESSGVYKYQPGISLYKTDSKTPVERAAQKSSIFDAQIEKNLQSAQKISNRILGKEKPVNPSTIPSQSSGSSRIPSILKTTVQVLDSLEKPQGPTLTIHHHHNIHSSQPSPNSKSKEEIEAEEKAKDSSQRILIALASAIALPILTYLLGKDMNEREDYTAELEKIQQFKLSFLDKIETQEEGNKNPHFNQIQRVNTLWKRISKRILSQRFTTVLEKITLLSAAAIGLAGALVASQSALLGGAALGMSGICASVYTWVTSQSFEKNNENDAEQIQTLVENLLDATKTSQIYQTQLSPIQQAQYEKKPALEIPKASSTPPTPALPQHNEMGEAVRIQTSSPQQTKTEKKAFLAELLKTTPKKESTPIPTPTLTQQTKTEKKEEKSPITAPNFMQELLKKTTRVEDAKTSPPVSPVSVAKFPQRMGPPKFTDELRKKVASGVATKPYRSSGTSSFPIPIVKSGPPTALDLKSALKTLKKVSEETKRDHSSPLSKRKESLTSTNTLFGEAFHQKMASIRSATAFENESGNESDTDWD